MILAHPHARPGRLVRTALAAATLTLVAGLFAAPAKAASASPTPAVAVPAASDQLLPAGGKHYGHHRHWKKRSYGHRRWHRPRHYGNRYYNPRPKSGFVYRFGYGGPYAFGYHYVPRPSIRPHKHRHHGYRH